MSDSKHYEAIQAIGPIAFQPSQGEALSEGSKVQFQADPLLLPAAQRRWSTGTKGTIDPDTGRYQAGRAAQGSSDEVVCTLSLNGIDLIGSLPVNLGAPGDAGEDEHWRALKSFEMKTPNFGEQVPPWMFNNGRQQLHVTVGIGTQIPGDDPGELDPDEMSTLALFELGGHQPLAVLDNVDDPSLSDKGIHWAESKNRNRYDLANQQQPSSAEPDVGHLVSYFVHCLAPKDMQRTFYAAVRDKFGFWHYSDKVDVKNTVNIRPASHELDYTVEQKEISGFKTLPPNEYKYHYFFDTVEYWILKLTTGDIFHFEIDDEPRTMIQWEEEAYKVRFVSYTGLIVGGDDNANVIFDESTLKAASWGSSPYPQMGFKDRHTKIKVEKIDKGTIAISNHRVSDVIYADGFKPKDDSEKTIPPDYRERATRPLTLRLYDRYGNSIVIEAAFAMASTIDHRNVLNLAKIGI